MSVVANVAINVDSRNAVSKLRQVQTQSQATGQAVEKLNATAAAASDKFKVAANGVKYFTDATGRARAENGRFLSTAERAAAGIRDQGDAAQQASGKLNGLRNALAGLGVGLALRKSFIDASELESAQSRIELVSKNFQQLAGIQDVAANAARKFNLSQSESLSALTDLGNRIGPTGASLEDVANVYEGFNTLLALNKVNSQNAASATLQLNQALGSGRLAGEEFNAISEATPQLLDAVAKVLGRNRGELKQLASDGQISSQVLIEALKRIRTEGAADLEASFGGAFGATRRFNAALEDFSATVGTELLPAITPIISKATEILKLFGQLPGPIKTTAVAVVALTAAFIALAPAVAAISLAAAPWLALAAGVAALTVVVVESADAQQEFNNTLNYAPIEQVAGKIKSLEKELAAAELKLLSVQSEFGAVSREAAFAEVSVDALRGALEQAQGEYKVRLLYQTVGVTPDARFFGPGFKAPTPEPPKRPMPLVPKGSGGGAKSGKDDAERKAEEKRRAAEELANLQGQVALKEKLFGIEKQIAVEKERGSLVTAAALEIDKALEERQTRIAEITRSKATQETKNAQIKDATLEADKKIYAVQQAIKEQAIERTKAFDQTIADLDLELALKTATTEQAREQLRLEAEIARIRGDKNLTPDQQQAIIGRKTELARPKTDKERLQGAADEVKLELEKLTDPINLVTSAAAGIGDAFATSFKGIISGSMTAKEALAGFFQSVADQFLDMAAQIIAKWIQMTILNTVLRLFPGGDLVGGIGGGLSSGFNAGTASAVPTDAGGWAASFGTVLPGRAKGGPVSGGQMYMVGERGPELFVPGRSGTIVANDKMGGGSTNVVVNVDAKGSSVEGNEQGANQLGRVISAAVQSELIKQQRPGGLLAR